MNLDLFANRINRVFFGAGVVRIEFCVLRPDEKGEVSPDTAIEAEDVHFTVTLPLGGYVRSVAELRKFTQELQAKGVLKAPPEGEQQNRQRRQSELQDLTSDDGGEEPLV
jgi:hypothetical protein